MCATSVYVRAMHLNVMNRFRANQLNVDFMEQNTFPVKDEIQINEITWYINFQCRRLYCRKLLVVLRTFIREIYSRTLNLIMKK